MKSKPIIPMTPRQSNSFRRTFPSLFLAVLWSMFVLQLFAEESIDAVERATEIDEILVGEGGDLKDDKRKQSSFTEETEITFSALANKEENGALKISEQLWMLGLKKGDFKKLPEAMREAIMGMDLEAFSNANVSTSNYVLPKKSTLHLREKAKLIPSHYEKLWVKKKTSLAEKRMNKAENELKKKNYGTAIEIAKDVILRNDSSPVAARAALMLAKFHDGTRNVSLLPSEKKALSSGYESYVAADQFFFEYISYILNVHGHTAEARIAFRVLIADLVRGKKYKKAHALLKEAFRLHKHLFYPTQQVIEWPKFAIKVRSTKKKISDNVADLRKKIEKGNAKLEIPEKNYITAVDASFYASLVAIVQLGGKKVFGVRKSAAYANVAYKALEESMAFQQAYYYSKEEMNKENKKK